MKLAFLLSSLLIAGLNAPQIKVTGDSGGVFQQTTGIRAGTFGDERFALVLTPAKAGGFSVSGHLVQNGVKGTITGTLTKAGVLRVQPQVGQGNSFAAD